MRSDKTPAFDSIVHVTPDGRWFETTFDASLDRLLLELDQTETARAVVVGLAPAIDNGFILKACSQHSQRLIPCGGFNPVAYRSKQEAVSNFRAIFSGAEFRAVKLHPRLNGFTLDDRQLLAILDELASWGATIPVWLDTFLYQRSKPLSADPVSSLQALALRYPSLKFVFLHSAGSLALALFDAVRHLPNVYLDLSYTSTFYRHSSLFQDLRFLCSVFDRRLVWGSDFPEVSLVEAHRTAKELVKGLSQEKKDNIMGNTLVQILGIEAA